jgi:alpha-tubulin suppressor-like RCC1 family protein
MRVYILLLFFINTVSGCTTDDDCSGDVCLSSVCTAVSSLPEWSCTSATPETTGNFKISGDCTMTVAEVVVSDHLKLYGVGNPTITAKTSGDRRHFNVGASKTLTLNGLKLTGGNSAGAGGSIFVSGTGGTLHATSCVFFLNTAGNSGGGVYNSGGSLLIQDSIIANNTAVVSGGGIRQNFGTAIITRSVISWNIQTQTTGATISQGGGGMSVVAAAVVTVRESTFENNEAATNNGHQILTYKSVSGTPAVTVVNTIFDNSDVSGGTDFYLYDADNTGNSGAAAYYSLTEKNCADGSYCTVAPYTGACTDVAQGMTCASTNCAENEYVSSNVCTACPVGMGNVAGDDVSGVDTTCDAIICGVNEYVSSNVCTTCPLGTTRAAGDDATGVDTTCDAIICGVNEYVSSNVCTACPVGTTRAAGDDATGVDTTCACGENYRSGSEYSSVVNKLYGTNGCADVSGCQSKCSADNSCEGYSSSTNKFMMASGQRTNCIILDQGLKCWGGAIMGEESSVKYGDGPGEMGTDLPFIDMGTDTISKMGIGSVHMCVLLSNGKVKCWGNNSWKKVGVDGIPSNTNTPPADPLNLGADATDICVGMYHSCAVLSDGGVKCWGWNRYGELGMPKTTSYSIVPENSINMGGSATQISCGDSYTCAIMSTGDVKCWGLGGAQLGQGDSIDRESPVPVDFGTGRTAVQIVAGRRHVCVLMDNSQVKCWGSGTYLGRDHQYTYDQGDQPGEMGDNLAVTDLGTVGTVVSLSDGPEFRSVCALFDNGKLKCWGANSYGLGFVSSDSVVGNGQGEMGDNLPFVDLGTGRTAVAVTGGSQFHCAVLDDASVKCFGWNAYGQLGYGDLVNRGKAADSVGDNLGTVSLGGSAMLLKLSYGTLQSGTADGYTKSAACVSCPTGTVNVAGDDANGNISYCDRVVPCGQNEFFNTNHQCEACASGTYNDVGDTVVGSCDDTEKCLENAHVKTDYSPSLLKYTGTSCSDTLDCQTKCTADSACAGYSMVNDRQIYVSDAYCEVSDGKALCWGKGTNYQGGWGSTADKGTPQEIISSGVKSLHLTSGEGCAVMIDGTVKCWGNGVQTPTDTGLTDVKQMSLNNKVKCVVKNNGEIWCWGTCSVSGECGSAASSPQATPVQIPGAVGEKVHSFNERTCWLDSGEVKCIGYKWYVFGAGTTTTPVTLTGVTNVKDFSLAQNGIHVVLMDGTVKARGLASSNIGAGTSDVANDQWQDMGLSDVKTVIESTSGNKGGCALTNSGTAKCWGYNAYGQVGDQTSGTTRYTPVDVLDINGNIATGITSLSRNRYRLGFVIDGWSYVMGVFLTVYPAKPAGLSQYIPSMFYGPLASGSATSSTKVSKTCQPCPVGYINDAMDDPSGLDTTCDFVPCSENHHMSSGVCTECPIGATRAAGDSDPTTDTFCLIAPCAANYRVDNNQCVACPTGMTNEAGDTNANGDTYCTSSTLCDINEYVSNHVCTACVAGTARLPGDQPGGPDTTCISGTLCTASQHLGRAYTYHTGKQISNTNGYADPMTNLDAAKYKCLKTSGCTGVTQDGSNYYLSDGTVTTNAAFDAYEISTTAHACNTCPGNSHGAFGIFDIPTDCTFPLCNVNEYASDYECVSCPADKEKNPAGNPMTDFSCDMIPCAENYHVGNKYTSLTASFPGNACSSKDDCQNKCTMDTACEGYTYKNNFQLSSGGGNYDHMCWMIDGVGYCFGATTGCKHWETPYGMEPMTIPDAVKIVAEYWGTCIIDSHGKAYCQGANGLSTMGFGYTGDSVCTLTQVFASVPNIVDHVGNYYGSCIITSENKLYCVGHNFVGDGTQDATLIPKLIAEDAKKIISGNMNYLLITQSGEVKTWGINNNHQPLGYPGGGRLQPGPLAQPINDAVDGCADYLSMCVVRSDGTLWCWGGGSAFPKLGVSYNYVPRQFVTDSNVVSCAITSYGACALFDNKTMACWGDYRYTGHASGSYHPPTLLPNTDVTAMSGQGDNRIWFIDGGILKSFWQTQTDRTSTPYVQVSTYGSQTTGTYPSYKKDGLGCQTCPVDVTNAAGDTDAGGTTLCDFPACGKDEYASNQQCVACEAGSFNDAGDNSGVDSTCDDIDLCEENEYSTGTVCLPCPGLGTRPAGDRANVATVCTFPDCQSNQYSTGDGICLSCPALTSKVTPVNPGVTSTCDKDPCLTDYAVSGGSCVPCPAGFINEAGDDPAGGDSMCAFSSCPLNHYVVGTFYNRVCTPCDANTYSPGGTATACGATPYCTEDQKVVSNACVNCPTGYSNPNGVTSTGEADGSCTIRNCRVNEYSDGTVCQACGQYTVSPDSVGVDPSAGVTTCVSSTCATDHYIENHECKACDSKSYRAAGDQIFGGDTHCFCRDNHKVISKVCVVCEEGSSNPDLCYSGLQDHFCICHENYHVSSTVCTACTTGRTRPAGDYAGNGDTACACAVNEYVSGGVCTSCSSGQTRAAGDIPTAGDTKCSCAEDEYVSSGVCTACPSGSKRTVGDDPTGDDTACACPENFKVSGGVCVACESVATKPAGDDPSAGNTFCVCKENAKVDASNQCVACPANQENVAGNDASGPETSCLCSANFYSTGSGCSACATGYSKAAGSDPNTVGTCDEILCAEDEYVSSNTCVPCMTGMVRPAGDSATAADTVCTYAGTQHIVSLGGSFAYNVQEGNNADIVIRVGSGKHTFIRNSATNPMRIVSAEECLSCESATYSTLPTSTLNDAISGTSVTVFEPTEPGIYYYVSTTNGYRKGRIIVKSEICSIPTTGTVTLTTGCELPGEIILSGDLEVTYALARLRAQNGDLPKISAASGSRHFTVGGGFKLTLSNVDLDGGNGDEGGSVYVNNGEIDADNVKFTNNVASLVGGAIKVENIASIVTLKNALFENNQGSHGGAISIVDDLTVEPLVQDSDFRNNVAAIGSGGAISSSSKMTISVTNFEDNAANAGQGGGLSVTKDLTITGSSFKRNKALKGGAIDSYDNKVTMANMVVENNTALEEGGAFNALNSEYDVSTSTIKSNKAKRGGAIRSKSTGCTTDCKKLVIKTSTLENNEASGEAGAIDFDAEAGAEPQFWIQDTTMTGNKAGGNNNDFKRRGANVKIKAIDSNIGNIDGGDVDSVCEPNQCDNRPNSVCEVKASGTTCACDGTTRFLDGTECKVIKTCPELDLLVTIKAATKTSDKLCGSPDVAAISHVLDAKGQELANMVEAKLVASGVSADEAYALAVEVFGEVNKCE